MIYHIIYDLYHDPYSGDSGYSGESGNFGESVQEYNTWSHYHYLFKNIPETYICVYVYLCICVFVFFLYLPLLVRQLESLFFRSSYHDLFKNIANVVSVCIFDQSCICVFVYLCICIWVTSEW